MNCGSAIALPESTDTSDPYDWMWGVMRSGDQALHSSQSRHELACLLLRVIDKLAPCTEASLIAYVSNDYTSSDSPSRHFILNALLELERLALIRSINEHIGITDAGRRFLENLPGEHLSVVAANNALVAIAAEKPLLGFGTVKRLCRGHVVIAQAVFRREFQKILERRSGIWKRALRIAPKATNLLQILAKIWCKRAQFLGTFLSAARRDAKLWLGQAAATSHSALQTIFPGRHRKLVFGSAVLAVSLSTAWALTFLWTSTDGSSREGPIVPVSSESTASLDVAAQPDASAPPLTRMEAVRIAVKDRLSEFQFPKEIGQRGKKAVVEYYSDPARALLWASQNGLTDRAQSAINEIAKADHYGLRASDYELPNSDGFGSDDAVNWLADAEVKLTIAVLRYADDARGGRLLPSRLNKNLTPTLTLPDPLDVLNSIAANADPGHYLRSLQPSHPQFELLRRKLLEIRREISASTPTIIIPEGSVLKKGVQHENVALLKKRLQVPSASGNEDVYDDSLDIVVRRFQQAHDVAPDGVVGAATRRLLNGHEQEALTRERLILLNMERWRWLPPDPDSFYVTVNVPEFIARVVKGGEVIHQTRVVVGKPDKQTSIFSDEMQEIVFNPFWSVPTSIKVEEIRPYLDEETTWFFGGWNTAVFQRHGLRVRYGGREVDPGTIDWNRVDIRNLEIYQPPGPDNVLGKIKFVFPNQHDVYLHDTTQKDLFAQLIRAESHGCVRVQNPEQLAAILLDYDQGWSASRVASAVQNGYDQHVVLKHKIPVHITYFTFWVNDDGSTSTFVDLYGHDAEMAAALFGDRVGFAQPRIANKDRETQAPRDDRARWDEAAGEDIVGSILRLLDN
jgi:murein L,D-transpeptidase YcbB/YkuD